MYVPVHTTVLLVTVVLYFHSSHAFVVAINRFPKTEKLKTQKPFPDRVIAVLVNPRSTLGQLPLVPVQVDVFDP